MHKFDWFIVSVDHLPYHYQIRGIGKEKKVFKMFQKFLGVYTLSSQSLSDSGPIYVQTMSGSETLKYTKSGEENFLYLAYESKQGQSSLSPYTNGSLVWTITPDSPKTRFGSQVSLPICANASNLMMPPSRGWYTGSIFGGWKHKLNIEVFPKGGKKDKN